LEQSTVEYERWLPLQYDVGIRPEATVSHAGRLEHEAPEPKFPQDSQQDRARSSFSKAHSLAAEDFGRPAADGRIDSAGFEAVT
jgi:hypothetical protein